MEDKQLNDSIFDALFVQAVIDNFYEEYNALPPLEELSKEYTFSEKHEKRMKALFARDERKKRYKKFVYLGRKVAAVFLILFTMFVGALMFNPDVRAAVAETIISWHREFVKIISPDAEAEGYSMIPTYVPEGFEEVYTETVNYSTLILYMNADGESILFEVNEAAMTLYVDNENSDYEVRNYEEIEYHILISLYYEGENSITWDIDGWRYFIRSSIDVEILFKIALSLG